MLLTPSLIQLQENSLTTPADPSQASLAHSSEQRLVVNEQLLLLTPPSPHHRTTLHNVHVRNATTRLRLWRTTGSF
jgi:hypothetical protein